MSLVALIGLAVLISGVSYFSVMMFVLIVGEDAMPALGVFLGAAANLMLLAVMLLLIEAYVRIRSTLIDDRGIRQTRWFKSHNLSWGDIRSVDPVSDGVLRLHAHQADIVISAKMFDKPANMLAFVTSRVKTTAARQSTTPQ
jgi:uncharacterized membrane protein YobD (UPF0266 family)